MSSFANDISRFIEKTGIKADVVLRKIAFDGLAQLIKMSPVDTGNFRSNWRVAVNRVDGTYVDGSDSITVIPANPAAGIGTIESAKWGDYIAISNATPYALALEQGKSKQAPMGMLRVTLLSLQESIQRSVQ